MEKKREGLKNPAAIMAIPHVTGAAKKVNKDTKNALSWAAVAGVGMVVFVAFKLARNVGKALDFGGGIIDEIKDDPGSGGGNVEGETGTPPPGANISPVQAQTIASQLANIMGGLGKLSGRGRNQVYEIMNGWNYKDYQLVSAAFGRVRRNPITGEIAPPLMGQKLNLTDWLTIEMQPEGIAHLRTITSGIF